MYVEAASSVKGYSLLFVLQNWVFVISITTSLFALIFFCNSVFSCSSFSAATETDSVPSFHYGFWGFQYDFGDCHSFEVVDGMMRLGRTLGTLGFMIGILLHFMLSLLCCIRAPTHIVTCVSAAMMSMALFAFTAFFGVGTHFCKVRNGTYDCNVTMNGYLVLVAAFLWLVGGVSLRFVKDRFDVVKPTSALGEDETCPSDNRRSQPGDSRNSGGDHMDDEEAASEKNQEEAVSAVEPERETDMGIPKVIEHENSTIGEKSKESSTSVVIEREHFPDGRQVIRTTRTSTRPDGTQVIEKDTIMKPTKRQRERAEKVPEASTCQWICEDLNQCNSSDNYRYTSAQDFHMATTTSGLTDDASHRLKPLYTRR